MPSSPDNQCCKRENEHPLQAFISHARKDQDIAKKAAQACCAADVRPFLFEYSAESRQLGIDNARTIAKKIIDSHIIVVVLSKSISKAYWTHAWIGFEIGAAVGAHIASIRVQGGNYFSGRIIVFQHIHHNIKVSIPRVDDLFLFDFNRPWEDVRELLKFISAYVSQPIGELSRIGYALKLRMLTGTASCKNDMCNGSYQMVVPFEDVSHPKFGMRWNWLHRKKIWWDKNENIAKCTMKCPSCGQKVTCQLVR